MAKRSRRENGESCKSLRAALKNAKSRKARGRALGRFAKAGCARRGRHRGRRRRGHKKEEEEE